MGKFFTFFGRLKQPELYDELFDKNGNVTDTVYDEAVKNMWHYPSKSFATALVIVADATINHKSVLRRPAP